MTTGDRVILTLASFGFFVGLGLTMDNFLPENRALSLLVQFTAMLAAWNCGRSVYRMWSSK